VAAVADWLPISVIAAAVVAGAVVAALFLPDLLRWPAWTWRLPDAEPCDCATCTAARETGRAEAEGHTEWLSLNTGSKHRKDAK
jgi:hypothetical protein